MLSTHANHNAKVQHQSNWNEIHHLMYNLHLVSICTLSEKAHKVNEHIKLAVDYPSYEQIK